MNVQKQVLGEAGEIKHATNYVATGEPCSGEGESPVEIANIYSQYVKLLLEAGGHAEIMADKISVTTRNERIIFSDATDEQRAEFRRMVGRVIDTQKTPSQLSSELDEMIDALPTSETPDFSCTFEQLEQE